MTNQETIERLKEGNKIYRKKDQTYTIKEKEKAWKDAKKGQEPFAIVLSCADSRVIPEMIFDTGIGELFVVRVAGNVANPASIASIEYAVAVLQVNTIVVLGHEGCGAVGAAIKNDALSYNLDQLLAYIKPAIDCCGANKKDGEQSEEERKKQENQCIKKNAILTTQTLQEQSVIINRAVMCGCLSIVPAFYKLGGKVEFLAKCGSCG